MVFVSCHRVTCKTFINNLKKKTILWLLGIDLFFCVVKKVKFYTFLRSISRLGKKLGKSSNVFTKKKLFKDKFEKKV